MTIVQSPSAGQQESISEAGGDVVPQHFPPSATVADPDVPRRIGARRSDDVLCLVGSVIGSFGLVWAAYTQLLPTSGGLGFALCWYVAFVALYAASTAVSNSVTVVVDRVAATVIWGGTLVVAGTLITAVSYPFFKGHTAIHHANFYTKDMSGVSATSPYNQGGILHAIVGTLIEIGIAAGVTVPLGVGTAVYMTEVGGKGARVVKTVVEAMTALPSIVAGLFIYTVFIVELHLERSGLAASMAIGTMMLPIVARASDVALRVVPGGLRQASLALGASQWETVRRVVLPTARSGLATAVILAVARGIGETSPVLLTSAANTYMNKNPLHGPMNSLPLLIFQDVRDSLAGATTRGYGGACVLIVLVLLLFIATRLLARSGGKRRVRNWLRTKVFNTRRDFS